MTTDGNSSKTDSDAFRILGWGLRRYAFIVLLTVVTLGYVVPAVLADQPARYESQAQVGPVEPLNLPNLDPLPRLGETVFTNGAVEAAVRRAFQPALPSSVAVIPERVELVAAQDNIVFTVIGRGETPQIARETANVAAATLAAEINKYTRPVGAFAIQRLAGTPAEPVARLQGPLATALGILAGLLAGVGVILALLAWRRPVVDAAAAEAASGAPVLAKLHFTSVRGSIRGLPHLSHWLRSHPTDMVLLTGTHASAAARRQLAAALVSVLGANRSVSVVHGGEFGILDDPASDDVGSESRHQRPLVVVDGPSPLEVATRPASSVVLLVAQEGVGYASLRKQAEAYLDGGLRGVVLVHGAHAHMRPRKPRRPKPGAQQPPKAKPFSTRRSEEQPLESATVD